MTVWDRLLMGLRQLRQNRLHTAINLVTIAIGTGALLLELSIAVFGQQTAVQAVETLGVSGVAVYLDDSAPTVAAFSEQLQQAVKDVERVMPIKVEAATAMVGTKKTEVVLLGADQNLEQIIGLHFIAGKGFTPAQTAFREQVVILDEALAQQCFGRADIEGQNCKLCIGGEYRNFRVVGVVRAQTGALGTTLAAVAPHLLYVPFDCLTQEEPKQLLVQCREGANEDNVMKQMERWAARTENGAHMQNLSGVLETVNDLTELGAILLGATGLLILFVALCGVLGSLLADTCGKTGEIGILLALGAQRKDILQVYLFKTLFLCFFGGICGTAAVALLLQRFASLLLPDARWIALTILLAACCGVLAGVLPAVQAARLNPVEAMRK